MDVTISGLPAVLILTAIVGLVCLAWYSILTAFYNAFFAKPLRLLVAGFIVRLSSRNSEPFTFTTCDTCHGWGQVVPGVAGKASVSRRFFGATIKCPHCSWRGVVFVESREEP